MMMKYGFSIGSGNISNMSLCSNIENLVFWPRSEITGSAAIKYHGVLEYWNVGILGLAE